MNRNITRKTRHQNTPTKQLVSIILQRYASAPHKERRAIIQFFNWAARNAFKRELKDFYLEIRSRVVEVKA